MTTAVPRPAASASELTRCIEIYFDCADRCDVAGTLATMAPDCVMDYLTDGVGLRHEGRDSGIRTYFEQRATQVLKSWHGDFFHVVDTLAGRVATRFAVRRTDRGLPERVADNINLFEFDGCKFKRITVWKSSGRTAPPITR